MEKITSAIESLNNPYAFVSFFIPVVIIAVIEVITLECFIPQTEVELSSLLAGLIGLLFYKIHEITLKKVIDRKRNIKKLKILIKLLGEDKDNTLRKLKKKKGNKAINYELYISGNTNDIINSLEKLKFLYKKKLLSNKTFSEQFVLITKNLILIQ